eukprot:TRINITY_DN136739_c0_g1_i1.p1 TRINITY_DN136739_c0_g1~~TRINITY_DN136739_c0_g1_i1.p1  ORF type:complete len:171 (+),score=84.12 TRINITY_DN136739_c0_g1_i1:72-584(+)
MLIPKKARKTILSYLFKEGVIVAKKDFNSPKHHEIDVANLYVIKLMQSMKSRSYVTETFNWQYFYWYLTNEGIEYLRGYLHLPEEIVPATLKKPRTPAARPSGPTRVPQERGAKKTEGTPETEKKVAAPSADFKPDFRGGYGRGGFRGGRDNYRRDNQNQGGFGRGQQRQ